MDFGGACKGSRVQVSGLEFRGHTADTRHPA